MPTRRKNSLIGRQVMVFVTTVQWMTLLFKNTKALARKWIAPRVLFAGIIIIPLLNSGLKSRISYTLLMGKQLSLPIKRPHFYILILRICRGIKIFGNYGKIGSGRFGRMVH